MRSKELFDFIVKRHNIYRLKADGYPKPWTADPILQSYRFCNVYRELDTQTIWFADNWRKRYSEDPDIWFASLMFRSINWHETTELMRKPLPWNPEMFLKIIAEREAAGEKVYNSAYMISTHGRREKKSTYLANSLTNIWAQREHLRYTAWEGLSSFHERLMGCYDVGSFLAAQVVADCKYVPNMKLASDWHTFCASGPGSRRGLNRVLGRDPKAKWTEEDWRGVMTDLQKIIDPMVRKMGMFNIHAQDLQNCLCEFDKYERVRLGEGRPKQRYQGV